MKVVFSARSWEDYVYWQSVDLKMTAWVNAVIQDAMRNPFVGIGKPEPLRNQMAGWWSRRIDQEHRLVYRVVGKAGDQALEIASCRFHYGT